MRRLVLIAIMACFPPSLLLVLMSGLGIVSNTWSGPSPSLSLSYSHQFHGSCGGQHHATTVGVGVVAASLSSAGLRMVGGLHGAGGKGSISSSSSSSRSSGGFVTGVAHAAVYSYPQHYHATTPSSVGIAVATTAYLASSSVYAGSWEEDQPAGTPQQLQPLKPKEHPPTGANNPILTHPGGEEYVERAPPETLKISILGPTRGKSSTCTSSVVEFSNTVSVLLDIIVSFCVCK